MNAPPDEEGRALLGIGQAAARAGVSERALRYYQEIGLLTPSGSTPGGMRRYSEVDLTRVAHVRELQELLGFNLEEIKGILAHEDRLAELRSQYKSSETPSGRRDLVLEGLALRREMRAKVVAKQDALADFLARIDRDIARVQSALDDLPVSV